MDVQFVHPWEYTTRPMLVDLAKYIFGHPAACNSVPSVEKILKSLVLKAIAVPLIGYYDLPTL